MKSKLVSVIVPVFNAEEYIIQTVNSILKQIYKNLEIILVNDGSTDNSARICDDLANKDKRINVIHKVNEGVSVARNTGLKLATGDYIFFIDADDYLDETIISDMIEYCDDYDIVKASYKFVENNKKVSNIISRNELYKRDDFIKEILSTDIGGHSWGYLLKKSMIEDIYFDENTSCMEDTIFIIECILRAENIKCIDSSYYNYMYNENGITCSPTRVFKNINDYMYSVNKIETIIANSRINYDYYEDLLRKKIILIEAEVAKITTKKDLKILFENKNINKELNNIRNNIELNILYKIFAYLIVNKKCFMMMSYIRARRLLKRLIKGR